MIAALFVDPRGPYFGRPDVDPWDESRDARNYRGPYPVIAHPPCGRWSKLAHSVAARYPHMPVGVDGGCFESALQAVQHWGGVLEHPAESKAWARYGLCPPRFGSWQAVGRFEWVTEVWQVDYGHRARKRTWLYYVGINPSSLRWERRRHTMVVGFSTNRCTRPLNERLAGWESKRTPPEFAEALIRLIQ